MEKQTLTELLENQVAYNFFEAPKDTQRFIVGTARSMAITFLNQFREEVEQIPTRDAGEIDYKGAQSDLITEILSYTGEVGAIGRGGRQVSRAEIIVPNSTPGGKEMSITPKDREEARVQNLINIQRGIYETVDVISKQRDALVRQIYNALIVLQSIPKPKMWTEEDPEDSSKDIWENNFEEISLKIEQAQTMLKTDYINSIQSKISVSEPIMEKKKE